MAYAGKGQQRGPRTLKRITDSYLKRLEVRAKSKSVRGATSSCAQLLRILGGVSAADLTEADIDRFVVTRRQEGVRDKTINGDLIILRAALNHAVRVGLLQDLPVKVRLLRVARRRVRKVLNPQELRRLLETAASRPDPRLYGIILIASLAGFRSGEILHLHWRDIDPVAGTLRVTAKPDAGWSPKSHQERVVFCAKEVFTWLESWKIQATWSGLDDFVFATKSGRPMDGTNVARAVRRVFEEAGLYESQNAVLHLLRHTAASRMLASGVDLETTRDVLGHADISTTALYLHSSDERKRAAATKLSLD